VLKGTSKALSRAQQTLQVLTGGRQKEGSGDGAGAERSPLALAREWEGVQRPDRRPNGAVIGMSVLVGLFCSLIGLFIGLI
jgi:hypothetical protein